MAATVGLGLVSHTNAGKTTLARTLLKRDVGEVRDAPHVTEFAEDHLLLRTEDGDELRLWDTPGFGDSVRLLRRLQQQGQPLGWFLSEVWDRWRDRAFWASQQALKAVRERADLVLYLVNAAESPEAAGYVEPEMQLLGWTGKPVIVLLNQLGAPRPAAEEAAEVEHWRRHLSGHGNVRAVLAMDAFARCWVQESVLLASVQGALDGPAQAAMARLRRQWGRDRLATFDAAMGVLATSLARLADAREPLDGGAAVGDALRRLGGAVGALFRQAGGGDEALGRAQRALAARLDDEVRAGTGELVALHGLEGSAQGEVLARVATQFELRERVGEGRAAVLGGLVTGALTGLKADLASGGLTMGGGMLAGGLIGALGAAGLARGWNVMRGGGPPWVGFSPAACDAMLRAALLRYLAVAHFGRGRGQWVEGEAPPHWQAVVDGALAPHRARLAELWAGRAQRLDAPPQIETLRTALEPLLAAAARAALDALYPGAWPAAEEDGADSPASA